MKLLQSDNKCQSGRLNGSADSGGYNGDEAQCPAGMCRCSVCQTVGYIFKKHNIIWVNRQTRCRH
ncbi:hypothetical protein NEISUBOT_03289 [Neisseria subflava NJ9703]|uniref:Uncharacterized protein n=1 Tax=Neisseria subflava NJ9703 TaxID=546268 RepID=A0A9W5N0C5_NEISU|nr:hypothetical protein NEISUBOT_03289 [Neisseria subflava NJ9703]